MNAARPDAPLAFLFFGVFTSEVALFSRVRQGIEARFGKIHPQGESDTFPFPPTRTYARTMGESLQRKFFVLEQLWPQDGLADVKDATLEMEAEIAADPSSNVERPVNIDPGLLNDCRIILASTKDYAHRIYRGRGIWEEITLVWEKGAFRPHPWTYRDFRDPSYHPFFSRFRKELLAGR